MSEIDELKQKLKELEGQLKNLEHNARLACEGNNENIGVVAQQLINLSQQLRPLFRDYRVREDAAYDRLFELVVMTQKYPM